MKAPPPKTVHDFVLLLAVTLKPGTCKNYRNSLRRFHTFLGRQNCSFKQLARKHLTSWLAHLHAKGLSPGTRSRDICCVRSYLRWLHEQGLLTADPEDLIRSTDIPRYPTYLPRPLPPEVDIELQNRLTRSSDPLHKALLLMRNTGIRNGELRALPYQCVRTDLQGNSFLKVPLGKLNNERLVPLDQKTLALVEELQAQGITPRCFLLGSSGAKRVHYHRLRHALLSAADGIELSEPLTTHRLRHTYATTLLTYGVSLPAIMRLLGHHDLNMTLRYADVTLNSVRKEFFDALGHTEQNYGISSQPQPGQFDPTRTLSDLIAWLSKARAPAPPQFKVQARLLIRRLTRAQNDLRRLIQDIPGD